MSTTQAPEPTSYLVEGDSYRKLIAERDAYKRIANDLARQLRERTPADTSAPPGRAAQETRANVCPALVDSAPHEWIPVGIASGPIKCRHCGEQR